MLCMRNCMFGSKGMRRRYGHITRVPSHENHGTATECFPSMETIGNHMSSLTTYKTRNENISYSPYNDLVVHLKKGHS